MDLIRERAHLLFDLIAEDPSQAIALSLDQDQQLKLRYRFPVPADGLESEVDLESAAVVYVEDDLVHSRGRTLLRMQDARGDVEVYFADGLPAEIQRGDVLRVHGIRLRNRLAAIGARIVRHAPASACSTTGDQEIAVLMVTFPGVPVPDLSKQVVTDLFFSETQSSVASHWRENSYGQASASGDVFGWYVLDRAYTCSEMDALFAAAIQAADADVNFRAYTRYFVISPSSPFCVGLSTIGCRTWQSAGDGTFDASLSWLDAYSLAPLSYGVGLAVHEGGHQLGLGHSRTLSYGEPLGPVGVAGTRDEYGDPYSAMGKSNPAGHYAAPHKAYLGWLTPGSNYLAIQASGTYTVEPLESSPAGTKAVKVRRGTGNNAWLWLEYRQPASIDSQLIRVWLLWNDGSGAAA